MKYPQVREMVPEMITIEETSKRSGLSYDSIRKKCMRNEIAYIRNGRKYLINWRRFLEYLNGDYRPEGQNE